MTKEIVVSKETFPTALAPGAKTLADVFKHWEEADLKPVEVSERDFQQTINIVHNALTGELNWNARSMDGIQALGLMADAIASMWEHFFGSKGRPQVNSGEVKIIINVDQSGVLAAFEKSNDPVVLKGALLATLWKIIDLYSDGEDVNPLAELGNILCFHPDKCPEEENDK